MHLHDLRSHPVIKFFAYIGFVLIIISFIFFYGWNLSSKSVAGHEAPTAALAKYRAEGPLSLLPWRKWDKISLGEVQRAQDAVNNKKMSFLPQQMLQFFRQQGNMPQWATQDEAMREAMDQRLLKREADRLGLVVPRDEIVTMLQAQWGKNPQALDMYLRSKGMTVDQFIAELTEQLRAGRAQSFILSQAKVSLLELWEQYVLTKEKITLKIASYPVSDYAEKVEASDADLQSHLEKHGEEYRVPDMRRYAYVKVSRDDIKKTIETTPDLVKAFYDENQVLFNQTEAVRVEDLFTPISKDQPTTAALALITKAHDGATTRGLWSDLARRIEHESPPGSRIYGREIGWVERSDTNRSTWGPAFMDRIATLANDAISTPVQSPMGFHVVRALEHREAGVPPFEKIQAEVETKYKDRKADELFKEKLKTLKEEVKRYNTVRDFALGVGLDDGLTTRVAATESFISEIGVLNEHRAYIKTLKLNQLSELIPVPIKDPNLICALQIVEENPSYIPKLDEVREQVEMAFRNEKAHDMAKEAAEAARKAVQEGKPFEEAIAGAPKPPVETAPFTRLDPVETLGAPLIGFQKETARLAPGSTGLSPFGADPGHPLGYAVWKALSLAPPLKEEFMKERRTFEREYLQLLGMTLIQEWLADKRHEAGFEVLHKTASR